MRLNALFRLGFPAAPDLEALNLATYRNSPAHFSIGTPSSDTQYNALAVIALSPAACVWILPTRRFS